MREYSGGEGYSIGGKNLRAQADSIIGAMDAYRQAHRKAGHITVWLNPCMSPAGTLAGRSVDKKWAEMAYSLKVKPPTTMCYIEEV
jgi:hypothetical protein